MTYEQREAQKKTATKLLSEATHMEGRAHAMFLRIEAHYHRNTKAPSLAIYASHWLWASQRDIPADALQLLLGWFPFPRRPKIQMGYSDSDSYGKPSYA